MDSLTILMALDSPTALLTLSGSRRSHVVSFLASHRAGFITGQRIVVDGGRSLVI